MTQTAEQTAPAQPATPFEIIGGRDAVDRLVGRFYDLMESAPEAKAIRDLHEDDLSPMREALSGFLTAWLGGPRDYFAQGGKCIVSAHGKFGIGAAERDQWLWCFRQAMADTPMPDEFRAKMTDAIANMAEAFRNKD